MARRACEIRRLSAVPTDPGFVLHELPLPRLRALMARLLRRGQLSQMRERLWCSGQFALLQNACGTDVRHACWRRADCTRISEEWHCK